MHEGIKKVNEETSPGLFALIRCLDPICEFIGEKPLEFIQKQKYSCKKLYSRIIPARISDLGEKIKKFKYIVSTEEILRKKFEISNEGYNNFDSWNFKNSDPNPIIKNKNLLKSLITSSLSVLDKMSSKTIEFMIDFLIPSKYKSILSEYNRTDLILFYGKKVALKSEDELQDMFVNFILAGDNFQKYFSEKSSKIYFPKFIASNVVFEGGNGFNRLAKLIREYYSMKNEISTLYESLKANKFLDNYIKKFNELNDSKTFK
jgi:hypothetical protein